MEDDILKYKTSEHKIVVANDNTQKNQHIFDNVHMPGHVGIKGMCIAIESKHIGFKRENIDKYVAEYIICKKIQPLKEVLQITPIITKI